MFIFNYGKLLVPSIFLFYFFLFQVTFFCEVLVGDKVRVLIIFFSSRQASFILMKKGLHMALALHFMSLNCSIFLASLFAASIFLDIYCFCHFWSRGVVAIFHNYPLSLDCIIFRLVS